MADPRRPAPPRPPDPIATVATVATPAALSPPEASPGLCLDDRDTLRSVQGWVRDARRWGRFASLLPVSIPLLWPLLLPRFWARARRVQRARRRLQALSSRAQSRALDDERDPAVREGLATLDEAARVLRFAVVGPAGFVAALAGALLAVL